MLEPGPVPSSAHKRSLARNLAHWQSISIHLAALLLFIGFGLLMAPLLGFEDDELIFINLFFHPNDAFSRLMLSGRHAIPIMAASYAGALKTWLYTPLLLFVSPSIWLVLVPVVLLAALSILLTGRLLTKIAGPAAGLVAICLIATDVTFLLTATFDWGPVVLQHLLLITALLSITEWHRSSSPKWLFLAGLSIGLALWDKSLVLWQLSGLTVALLLLAFPSVKSVWSRTRFWIFTRGLLLGAFPLIAANCRHHFATIRDNGHMSPAEVSMKAAFIRAALDGQAATTFLVERWNNNADHIHRPFGTLALTLAHSLGDAPSLWRFYPGLLIILIAVCLASTIQRKWILFFLLSGFMAWIQSALTIHAGNVVHHAVLHWVSWYCALSLSFTVALESRLIYIRLAAAFALLFLIARGILVLAASYGLLILHPATPRWTNADSALVDHLLNAGVKRVVVVDWGIKNVISIRSRDRIAVDNQAPQLNLGSFEAIAFNACLTPSCVVVTTLPVETYMQTPPPFWIRICASTASPS